MKSNYIFTFVAIAVLNSISQAQVFVHKPSAVQLQWGELFSGPIDVADIDNDGDDDVFGLGKSYGGIGSGVLMNDNGVFSNWIINRPRINGDRASLDFGDVNGDGYVDVYVSTFPAYSEMPNGECGMLLGSGSSGFTAGVEFKHTEFGSTDLVDVNGDDNLDLILTGDSSSINIVPKPSFRLFLGDGQGGFVQKATNTIEAVTDSQLDYADVDNDGDIDLMVIGKGVNGVATAKLYLNDGAANFVQSTNNFDGIYKGCVKFLDSDNDGDQDIVQAGFNGSQPITQLYINDGQGSFVLKNQPDFEQLTHSWIEVTDVDGDSDVDIVIMGSKGIDLRNPATHLYLNDGTANFTKSVSEPFTNLTYGSCKFLDYDGDSDLDLFISGYDSVNVKNGINDFGNHDFPTVTLYENVTPVSVNTINKVSSFSSVYPTVSRGSYTIDVRNKMMEDVRVRVIDSFGREVSGVKKHFEGNLIEIVLSNISSGNYLIEISSGREKNVHKVIVE